MWLSRGFFIFFRFFYFASDFSFVPGLISFLTLFLLVLFGSEDTVTGVAKTRADVCVIVQFTIKMSTVDLYIRMSFVKAFQSFRCCNDAHKFDIFSTLFLNEIDRCFCGTAGCKHRVNNHCDTLINGFRKFTVVFVWFVCYRITVKS